MSRHLLLDDLAEQPTATAAPSKSPRPQHVARHAAPEPRERLPWRSPRATIAAMGLPLIAIAASLGIYVTHVGAVATGELGFDVALAQHRNFVGIAMSESVDMLLGPVLGPAIVVLLAGVLYWRRHRLAAVLVVGLTLGGWLTTGALKLLIQRARPPYDTVNALIVETGHDSFPSGHTALMAAGAAAAVVTLWTLGQSRVRCVIVAVLGTVAVAIVGFTRLYLGAHYYVDVIAAPICAAGTVLIIAYVAPRLARWLVVRRPALARPLERLLPPTP